MALSPQVKSNQEKKGKEKLALDLSKYIYLTVKACRSSDKLKKKVLVQLGAIIQ